MSAPDNVVVIVARTGRSDYSAPLRAVLALLQTDDPRQSAAEIWWRDVAAGEMTASDHDRLRALIGEEAVGRLLPDYSVARDEEPGG